MKVLVTGSEGFIGKYVCKELERRGHEVIPFDKKLNPNDDLLYANLREVLYDIDTVIHMASLVGLKYCMENPLNAVYQNIVATTKLLEACKLRIPFVYVSTWAVVGNLENSYDITKKCAEDFVISYQKRGIIPKVRIIRLGTTYGEGMSNLGVIPTMIKLAKEGKPLKVHGKGEQIRQFTHVEDAARGICDVLEKGKDGETYYCVADEITSVNQIAKALSENIEYVEAREGDEVYTPLDNSKLKKLGWRQLISFKEGMRRMSDGET